MFPFAVQYSQRDPLYESKLSPLGGIHNDLKVDDLLTENNHLDHSYHSIPKHVIERPVYLKEPEPIIEIIIKESNVTLAPPIEPVTLPPKKREQVQVFYVKYKKNPHGTGKDAVIYDKPIPALTPVKHEEEEEEQSQPIYQTPELVTSAPPPSTTLRAIIKPDSESYHADNGVHITFGAEHNLHSKVSHDDVNEESAPLASIAYPQPNQHGPPGPPIQIQKRQPVIGFNNPPQAQRLPNYRPFDQPPPHFGPQFGPSHSGRHFPPGSFPQLPNKPPANFNGPPSFGPPLNGPQYRKPVPYKPFDQFAQQNSGFSRHQNPFPTQQQLPLVQQTKVFNQQLSQQLPRYPGNYVMLSIT